MAFRPNSRKRGYTSEWDKATKLFIAEHPLCVGCQALGLIEPATVTDHIIPHRGSNALFWDRGNWQPCCEWHHNAVKHKLEELWLNGQLMTSGLDLDSPEAIAMSRRTVRRNTQLAPDGWPLHDVLAR